MPVDVSVRVDEAGRDEAALRGEHLGALGGLVAPGQKGADDAVVHEQIGVDALAALGVDQRSAGDKQS